MTSNYRKIGDFIQLVDERNKDLKVTKLLGLSISKQFIPSVANTIGTNMKNYKIIRKNQFACSTMQVRRDKKMPVALSQDFEEAIISQAYPVFEVVDETQLNPEYLMMWFSRSEFDRHACFLAVGGVRGSLEWEDFLEMPIPIPSIEKQREIVKEYNTIVNRIKLNETLNQKLEETAQALYKHWFVDFDFPITKKSCPELVSGSPELEGKPYKSSGGEMVYNAELDVEIPEGWEVNEIDSLIDYNYSNYSKEDSFESIYYLDTSSITENKIEELQHLIVSEDVIPSRAKRKVEHNDIVYSTVRPNLKHYGLIKNPEENMLVSTGFMVIKPKQDSISSELLFLCLTSAEITKYLHAKAEMSVSTYPSIKPEDILEIKLALPNDYSNSLLEHIEKMLRPFFKNHWVKNEENKKLFKMKDLILSKMSKVETKTVVI
ncbi:restriction endonuclease subunit S [Olleya sp. Ti.3.14]|uniref:restriction endonuclease subunit S n=1 Tax=Olleya sp. Ti.3.14 TaxID=3121297 RepID=UPI00311FE5A9